MSQHHKLARGGLVLFLAATHVGCAGSGLKNLFTRNETDGYHSVDELEAEERKLAEAEESGYEEETPSIAARLASWRPFSKAEPNEDEYASTKSDAADKDPQEPAKNSGILSRALARREAVDPDPFLESESSRNKSKEATAPKAAPNREHAKLDDKAKNTKDKLAAAEDEFVIAPDRKEKSSKDASPAAVERSEKPGPSATDNESDDALAKRFEQHFLLNSAATMAKAEANDHVTEGAEKLQKKAATIAAGTDSKRRDVAGIAERQIDDFDYLLGSDSGRNEEDAGSGRKTSAEPLKASRRADSVDANSADSLAAFDSLMGTESKVATHHVIEVAHKVIQEPVRKNAAVDINVADAESLFGAAAARQNARAKAPAVAQASNHTVDLTSGWSQASKEENEFQWNDSQVTKGTSENGGGRGDMQNSFARHLHSNSSDGRELFDTTAFGAPSAVAGNVEGDEYDTAETNGARLNNTSASVASHRTPTEDSGRTRAKVRIHPTSLESSLASGTHFTAAPVAPVPEADSTARVAPAVQRPGLIRSLSVRNWLLLLGGIIVIALLFAPGRTKPAAMTGRPANG